MAIDYLTNVTIHEELVNLDCWYDRGFKYYYVKAPALVEIRIESAQGEFLVLEKLDTWAFRCWSYRRNKEMVVDVLPMFGGSHGIIY